MKQLLIEIWFCFWGKNYLVNHNTKEIHRIKYKHVNCNIAAMTNKKYVDKEKALTLISQEAYNGCRYCWPDKDNG